MSSGKNRPNDHPKKKGANPMYEEPFIDACLNGHANYYDLTRYIDYWHNHETGKTLQAFLGMTDEEYQSWATVFDRELYDTIIQNRRKQMAECRTDD